MLVRLQPFFAIARPVAAGMAADTIDPPRIETSPGAVPDAVATGRFDLAPEPL